MIAIITYPAAVAVDVANGIRTYRIPLARSFAPLDLGFFVDCVY